MDSVKLPDLSKLKGVKQRLKKLPPQKSASDTSNWESRNISAPTLKITREFELDRVKDDDNDDSSLSAAQLHKLLEAKKQPR